jgi:hypothetical protein
MENGVKLFGKFKFPTFDIYRVAVRLSKEMGYELSYLNSFPGRDFGIFLLTVSFHPAYCPMDYPKLNGLSANLIHHC